MVLSQSKFISKFQEQHTFTPFTGHNMNKMLFLLVVGLASPPLCGVAAVSKTNTWSLASPDRQCEISVSLEQDRLNYQASRAGKVFIQKSPLGLRRDDQNFEHSLSFERAGKVTSRREKYELLAGVQPRVDHRLNFRILTFRNAGGGTIEIDRKSTRL